jgi:tetratricopeptide (TPR) repeat protein
MLSKGANVAKCIAIAGIFLAVVGRHEAAHAEGALVDPCGADRSTDIWTRTRLPGAPAYCRAIAEAEAQLIREDGTSALAKCDLAEKALPKVLRTRLVEGRAFLRLGRTEEAATALAEAKQGAPALFGPAEELDYARALLARGDRAKAAASFRVLLPRAERLGEEIRRAALVEAAWNELLRAGGDVPFALQSLRDVAREPGPLGNLAAATLALAARAQETANVREETTERPREDALDAPPVRALLARVGALGELAGLRATAQTGKEAAASWKAFADAPSHAAFFAPLATALRNRPAR